MLRISTKRAEPWCDKTMSVLKERQLEACQERLTRCPAKGIFDDVAEDEAIALYQFSFYAQESRRGFPGLDAMRRQVKRAVEREACFLTPREDGLVKRMLMNGGKAPLDDWDDISAAEALVSRLWCSLIVESEESAILQLSDALMGKLMQAMLSSDYTKIREKIFHFDATMHSMLYLIGFLHAEAPVQHFIQYLKAESIYRSGDEAYVARFQRAGFDYIQSREGDMLLLHPGLADPEHLLTGLSMAGTTQVHVTREMMMGGMNSMLPEETASARAMRGAIHGSVRPELDEDEALEDLRMMAKQGAGLAEMRQVLESMLCVLPTPRMISALNQLHLQTVRWIGMPSAVLN
ncbi:MAG: hypothetical protein E7324_10610 [Clostridiales bacterium]|nr:hypothetical protein [Clostridiales bacterium]